MFNYIGKMQRNINLEQIEELLKESISNQQKGIGRDGFPDTNPENISILDYAYVEAQPDCYIVYATWTIRE